MFLITCWACLNCHSNLLLISRENWSVCCILVARPAFLPDPNDGSLYSLGGKNNEGLTVRGNDFIKNVNLLFAVRHTLLSSLFYRKIHFYDALAVVLVLASRFHIFERVIQKNPVILYSFVDFCLNRNYLSLSLSWSKPLPVAALMESFTWVRLIDFLKKKDVELWNWNLVSEDDLCCDHAFPFPNVRALHVCHLA